MPANVYKLVAVHAHPVSTANAQQSCISDTGLRAVQGCICDPDYRLQRNEAGETWCRSIPPPPWRLMVPLYVLGLVLLALVAKYTANLAVHSSGQTLYTLGPDKTVPPVEGQLITLVMTDVEGSTELWEWDHHTMLQVCICN